MAENSETDVSAGEKATVKDEKKPVFEDETPIESRHELIIGDRTLHYKAIVGRLPLKNYSQDKPEIEAQVFFTY